MNLFRTLAAAALLTLGGAGASSCLKAPDFPLTPAITFRSLTSTYTPRISGASAKNLLEFAVDFQDGDGDLGLDAIDVTVPPYNSPTGGHNNLSTGYNYFIQAFKKDKNGKFMPFITTTGSVGEYDGRYPRLETSTDGKAAPLKGTLRYKLLLSIDQLSYFPGDVFRFDISIMDRAFHESNTVTTSEVTLGQ